jgi:hypothetical protein
VKYPVKLFKSLAIALKEIELFVRNGMHLRTGAPFDNFREMRSREALANWLLCAVFNSESQPDRLKIASTSDPLGGDGVLVDTMTDETWPTEHVMALVPPKNEDDLAMGLAHRDVDGRRCAKASGLRLRATSDLGLCCGDAP